MTGPASVPAAGLVDPPAAAGPRRWLLGGALLATVGLCAWLAGQVDDEAAPTGRVAAAARPAGRATTPGAVAATAAASGPAERTDWPPAPPMALAAWAAPQAASAPAPRVAAAPLPPPPVVRPAAPPPPPPPKAPAFGYTLIGTVEEGALTPSTAAASAVIAASSPARPTGRRAALLHSDQRSLWARPGDVIDGAWRVVSVSADAVQLLWGPQQLPAAVGYRLDAAGAALPNPIPQPVPNPAPNPAPSPTTNPAPPPAPGLLAPPSPNALPKPP